MLTGLGLGTVWNVFNTVLPDEPTVRGAATSLRAEAFGVALPLVASGISLANTSPGFAGRVLARILRGRRRVFGLGAGGSWGGLSRGRA